MQQLHRLKKISMARLQSKLRHFRQQIICRKVPHTIVSWRFVCPGNDPAVLLHRRVFLNAWNQHGRIPQYMIIFYSLVIWYGWQSWRQVFRVWFRQSLKLYQKLGTPRSLQLYDLLLLALFHGIPPIFYYRFRLFQQPPRRWLNFIYNHELPHWHTVMADSRSEPEVAAAKELLGDKFAFAKKMALKQITAIPTTTMITGASEPDPELIFRKKNLFLKPVRANQCRNCYELLYDFKRQDYELSGIRGTRSTSGQNGRKEFEQRELESVIGQTNILTRITQLTGSEDFLIQPLLVNHPQITAAFTAERLVTIRFVTGHDGRQILPLSAVLEVPHHHLEKGWHLYTIEIETGCVRDNEFPLFFNLDDNKPHKPQIRPFAIPDWPAVIDLVQRAHTLFPALPTIGWDIAVTDCGPIVIEGNFNWSVNQAQILNGKPLLSGRLLDAYEELWNKRQAGTHFLRGRT